MAATETPQAVVSAARVPGPARAAARAPGRGRRPADRRGRRARRRRSGATPTRASRRSTSSSSPDRARPTRSGPATCPTAPTTCSRTPQAADFDDSGWERLAPADTMRRLSTGRVCFNWYRIDVTIPERVGDLRPDRCDRRVRGRVDDYAEVWVNGEMPLALGLTGGQVVGRLQRAQPRRAHPRRAARATGSRSPCSASTARSRRRRPTTSGCARDARLLRGRARVGGRAAAVASSATDPRLDEIVPPDVRLERVAGGFEFTEGPVWSPDGALLFSSPNTNAIYRLDPDAGRVTRVPLQERLHRRRHRPLPPARLQRPDVLDPTGC